MEVEILQLYSDNGTNVWKCVNAACLRVTQNTLSQRGGEMDGGEENNKQYYMEPLHQIYFFATMTVKACVVLSDRYSFTVCGVTEISG